MKTAVAVAVVALTWSSRALGADAEACAPLTTLEARWSETDEWQALPLAAPVEALPNRGTRDRLTVRGRLPAQLGPSPALSVEGPSSLIDYSVDGGTRGWTRALAFELPLRPDDGGKAVTLTFEARGKVAPGRICVARSGETSARALREDLPQFVVGAILSVLGLMLLAATGLRRERTPEYTWLGVFVLPLGLLSVAQSTAFRLLLGLPDLVWYVFSYPTVFVYPIGLARYVLHVFGDTRRRFLHWASVAIAIALPLAAALDVVGLVRMPTSRRFVYPVLIAIGVVTAIRARARREEPEARLFLGGFALLFVFALPDVLWGMGYPVVRSNVAPYGILVFALALVSILDLRFRTQRRALEGSMRTAEERANALSENQRALESANEELRHQVETRSRELKLALSPGRAQGTAHAARVPSVGEVLGSRYIVERELGAGAMGSVYLVERRTDGKRFALKTALGVVTPEGAARMAREAEIAAKIRHEHLVSVIDVGLDGGVPFLVMEFVQGRSLADANERYGDLEWALPLLHQIASGLAALHAHGIIHRDLKPANVLLASGGGGTEYAKISDFGIARFGADDDAGGVSALASTMAAAGGAAEAQLTKTGALMGTPLYMAPEAVKTTAITTASDVFAFGIMAYELLAAAYPYVRPPILSALSGAPIPDIVLPDHVVAVAPESAALIARALATDPRARPTAKDLAHSLRAR